VSTQPTASAPARDGLDGTLTALVGVLAAVLAWLRLTTVTRDVVWAEDGAVFLRDGVDRGPIGGALEPYAGYLHLVPRVVAGLVVDLVPATWWATALAATSCLAVGAAAALVHRCAHDLVASRVARVALAALTVAVPTLPLEVLGNLANLHWLALWTLPWLLVARPRGRVDQGVLAAATLVATLTEVQSVLLAPLLAWRWRDAHRLPTRIAYCLGVAAQLVTLVTADRPGNGGPAPGADATLRAFGHDVLMTLWLGTGALLRDAHAGLGLLPAAAVALVVGAAAVVVLVRGDALQRAWAVGAPVLALVLWVVAVRLNTPTLFVPGQGWVLLRYAVVPSMLVASVVVLGVALVPARPRWRVPALLVVAPALVVAVLVWRPPDGTTPEGPRWSTQARDAHRACVTDPAQGSTVLALAPARWYVRLPCEALGG
jgi:hypothetical protein